MGYAVRFDDCRTDETKIVYMTDGMLVRETMMDPLLSKYSYVFVVVLCLTESAVLTRAAEN